MSNRDTVGPVLVVSELSHHVINAIKQLNHSVDVKEYGSYLRVLVPMHCRLTKQAVEEQTGMAFILPDSLELIMPSFKGKLSCSDDEAVWSLHKKEVVHDER